MSVSPGLGVLLSTVTVVTRSDFCITITFDGVVVTGVLAPSVPGVGVVTVAVLEMLPDAFLLNVPRINMVAVVLTEISGKTVLPVHEAHVAPLSVLYCGFSTAVGTVSFIVGVLAVAGPSLRMLMVKVKTSSGLAADLSAVFSALTFATSLTGVMTVDVLLAGVGSSLVLVPVTVVVMLPVVLSLIFPRISNCSVPPLGMSVIVVVPVHGIQVLPPSFEYSTLVS